MIETNGTSSKVNLKNFDPTIGLKRDVSKFKETCWYLIKMVFFLSAFPFPSKFKSFLLRAFGARIGIGVNIKPRVNFHMPWKLEIGDYVWIGEEVFVLNFEQVKIGNNVCISQRAFLCGGNHDFRDPSFGYRNGPIIIEDGAWVGASCFVGPNVIIGIDTVVTAGSIVTTNLNSNSIYKGNPIAFVKERWN